MIQISAKQDGFRRCGIAHPKQATQYPDKHFTADQLKILQGEPMLVVQVIEGGEGADDKKTRVNAKDTITLVKLVATNEELDIFEAANTDRQSVLDAIAKRRTELETPQE